MFIALIKDHLLEIEKLELNANSLLVYKGFPVNFLVELSKTYPFLSPIENVFIDGRVNLDTIFKNIRNLIGAFLNKGKNINILTYEEFTLLVEKVDLSLFNGEIVIFQNNVFSEYPNQSNQNFIDIEQAVEGRNLSFKENEIFNTFYSFSFTINDIQFIQYKSAVINQFSHVRILDFFTGMILQHELEYKEIESEAFPEKEVVVFPASNNYYSLKYRIFIEDKLVQPIFLITDPLVLSHKENEQELKIIQYILKKNGLESNIFVKKYLINQEFRNDFTKILSKYWRSDNFRKLFFYKNPALGVEKIEISQGSVVEDIVKQSEKAQNGDNFNDIFLTAPTGSGKSVLFQIPALYITEKYNLVTIVVSPLKALMRDQVEALNAKGVDCACFINSDISLIDREKIIEDLKNGGKSILYLSPELLLSYDIRNFVGVRKIGLLVIDEAHLVTTWGRDFRVDYWYLGGYIRRIRRFTDYSFPILAVTATAVYTGKNDIVFETVAGLNMKIPKLYIGNVRRDEIIFHINEFKYEKNHELAKLEKTKQVIEGCIDKKIKTIMYFPWISQIKDLLRDLSSQYASKAGAYYSDLDKTEKEMVLEDFKLGQRSVVLATKAFGMGVDISDIKLVYHHAPSGSLSDYIQEIGRVARDKTIKGVAGIDFCEKDLKFTKILYGLSSIKQFQVKMVLEKLWGLYSQRKKQNFLVSAEDFGFIFSDVKKDEVENKVKSALLLLEKDLLKKYLYNVVLVRPKSLFSVVFACVPNAINVKFIDKYGEYCHKVSSVEKNVIKGVNSESIQDHGYIYQIYLDRIWEKFFYKESFPMVKKRFFDSELFIEFKESIIPKYRLTIDLKYSKEVSLDKIEWYFSKLDSSFGHFGDKYFSKKELEGELINSSMDEITRRRVVDLFISLYTSKSTFGNITGGSGGAFIQTKRDENGESLYKVVSYDFLKMRHMTQRCFDSMFPGKSMKFDKYIFVGKVYEFRVLMAFLIESLLLGTYEISGGQSPMIFVRINDPARVRILSMDQGYKNEVLRDVENRQKDSVEIMEKFFMSKMKNNERWNFIENYFLGM